MLIIDLLCLDISFRKASYICGKFTYIKYSNNINNNLNIQILKAQSIITDNT